MSAYGKIFLVDSNLFLVKRLTDALRPHGFEVVHCSEPVYALTMIEWNMPVAILCSMSLPGTNAFEIPGILRADTKTKHIPVIAIGDRGQHSQLEALRAGYSDFLDRRLGADEIAAHLLSFLSSRSGDGFQPTQMLATAETAMHGRLSLVDLPGVIQVLEQSRQTGALHVNAKDTDGIIFFNEGEVLHAESGEFAGDGAIVHLIKSCHGIDDGIYKFVPGGTPTLRTVQGTLSGLLLDALRELDEQRRDAEVHAARTEQESHVTAAEGEENPPAPVEEASEASSEFDLMQELKQQVG